MNQQTSLSPNMLSDNFYSLYASITDRQEQWELLDDLSKNEPAFQGMSPEKIGSFMNWKLGQKAQEHANDPTSPFVQNRAGEKGAGYDRFNSATRWLDAAGYNVRESWTNIFGIPGLGTTDLGIGGGEVNSNIATFGQLSGAAFRGLADLMGVEEAGQDTWEQAGKGLPGGLGSLAFLAAGPAVGTSAMLATVYGGAVDDAKSRGYGSGKAFAAGAIDTAVNYLTLKMGTGLAPRITEKFLASSGAAKALADTAKMTGKEMLKESVKQGSITPGKATIISLGTEAITNAAQSTLGISGEVAREFMLDPEQAKLMISDPNYWGSTLLAESGMAAFGTVMGRYNHGKELAREAKMNAQKTQGSSAKTTGASSTGQVDSSVQQALDNLTPEMKALLSNDPTSLLSPSRAPERIMEREDFEFFTEQGSSYRMFPAGYTQRYIPPIRQVEPGGTLGYQPSVAKTFFVDEEVKNRLANTKIQGNWRMKIDSKEGKLSVITQSGEDTWTPLPNFENLPVKFVPEVGMYPLEGHKQDAKGWFSFRSGSKIVAVKDMQAPVFLATVEQQKAGNPDASDIFNGSEPLRKQVNAAKKAVIKGEKQKTGTKESPAVSPIVQTEASATLEVANRLEATQNQPTTQASSVEAAKQIVKAGELKIVKTLARTTPFETFHDLNLPEGVKIHRVNSADVRGNKFSLEIDDNSFEIEFGTDENGFPRFKVVSEIPENFPQHSRQLLDKSIVEMARARSGFESSLESPIGDIGFQGDYSPETQVEFKTFFESSGILKALQKINGALTFKKLDKGSKNFFEIVNQRDRFRFQTFTRQDKTQFVIFHDSDNLTTLHEMGHLVDSLLSREAFGPEFKSEWDALKLRMENAADDQELGIRFAKKLGNELDRPLTLEQVRAYRKDKHELAAEAFQGYMLNKETPFKNFVRKNFPKLHSLFTSLSASFVKAYKGFTRSSDSSLTQQSLNYYSPLYQETKQFFDRLFYSVKETSTLEQKFRNKVNNGNLSGRVATAYAEILANNNDPKVHEAAGYVVDTWLQGKTGDEDLLISQLRLIDNLKHTSFTTDDVRRIDAEGFQSQDLLAMPNVKKLMDNLDGAIMGTEVLQKLPKDLQEAFEKNYGKDKLVPAKKQMLEVISELMSQKQMIGVEGGTQGGLAMQFAQLARLDHVVGQWVRGEFPEQKGIPMWDKRTFDVLETVRRLGGVEKLKGDKTHSTPLEPLYDWMERKADILQSQFPLLWGKIKANVKGSGAGRTKIRLPQDGTVDFEYTGKKKPMVFLNAAEAEEYAEARNAQGDTPGITFKAVTADPKNTSRYVKRIEAAKKALSKAIKDPAKLKEALDNMDGVYQIEAYQDSYKKASLNYESFTQDLVSADYHEASLPDAPSAAKAVNEIQTELRKLGYEKANSMDAISFLSEFMGRVFKRLDEGKMGIVRANPDGFNQLVASVETYRRKLEDHPYQDFKFKSLAEFVGGEKDPVRVWVKVLEMQSKGDGDLLQELQSYMSHEWVNFSRDMANVASNVLLTEMDIEVDRIASGKVPRWDLNSFRTLKHLDRLNPVQQPEMHGFLPFLQRAQDDGMAKAIESGWKVAVNPKSIAGKLVGLVQDLHHGTFGNILQIASSNPIYKVFSRRLVNEFTETNLHGTSAIEYLHLQGELVKGDDGDWTFRRTGKKLDQKAYFYVNANPDLKHLAKTTILASQVAKMTMQKMLDFVPDDMQGVEATKRDEAIADLKNQLVEYAKGKDPKKLDEDMTMLREFVYRTYEGTLSIHRARVVGERKKFATSLALIVYRGSNNDITTHQAHDLMHELNDLLGEQPEVVKARHEKLAQMTGWDAEQVKQFDVAWMEGQDKITKLGVMFENSKWYASEQRYRRYTVSYAVTDGPEKGRTGMRDFDEIREAVDFIKNPPKNIKPKQKNPTDQYEKKGGYRSFSSRMDEAVNHVVSSRREVMGIMLNSLVEQGKLTTDEMQRIMGLVTSIESEIKSEAGAGSNLTDRITRRYFKPGREHLDMTDQIEKYIWNTSIEQARALTDVTFALFGEDPNVRADKAKWDRMKNARDMLRSPDSKMQRAVSKAAFTMFMAGNVSTALIEVMQFPISLSHILVENGASIFDAFRIPAKLAGRSAKAALDRLLKGSDELVWNNEESALIRIAEMMGRLNVRNYIDLNDDNIQAQMKFYRASSDPGWNGQGAVSKVGNSAYMAMNKFYGFFNRINAELSLVSAYNVLKKQRFGSEKAKLSEGEMQTLFEEAMEIADAANGSHGRVGRPRWMTTRDDGMKTVGQMAWSLQAYASNYIANWLRLMDKSLNGEKKGFSGKEISASRRALAVMTATQVAGFGVMGIPLVGPVAKIIQMVLGEDIESEVKEYLQEKFDPEDEQGLADTILYGLQKAAGITPDIRSRLAVSGIGPLNNYEGFNLSEFGGPLLGLTATAINGMRAVSRGDSEPGRALMNFLPIGFQRAARMMFYDEGNQYTRGGKFVMEMTPTEKVFSVLGFGSARYSDWVKGEMMKRFANEQDAEESSRVSNELAELVNNNAPSELLIPRLHNEAKRLNKTPKQLADQINQKIMNKLFPSEVTGRGPNAQRAARLYPSSLPRVEEVKKEQVQLKTMAKLGMLPKNWQQRMTNAFAMDQIAMQNPNIPKSLLKLEVQKRRMQSTLPPQLLTSPRQGFEGFGTFAP